VHSHPLQRASTVAEQLRTGMAHLNDVSAKDAANAPFGGIGTSGYGSRKGGTANLMTRIHSASIPPTTTPVLARVRGQLALQGRLEEHLRRSDLLRHRHSPPPCRVSLVP
jgi:delta 1-pyrroline-5-carboxylate dehydrogenase